MKKKKRRRNPLRLSADVAMHHPSADQLRSIARRHYAAVVLFFAACAVVYVVCYAGVLSLPVPSPDPRVLRRSSGALAVVAPPDLDDLDLVSEDLRLERALKDAAMVDKTVILTTLNAAWASPGSVLDLFLESFRIGERTRRLLDHLVIVALDREAYRWCKVVHAHCFALSTEGVDFSGQKNFMSHGYLKMMWRRIDFLRTVLEMGYDFIFTDTDVMWFRDPSPYFYMDGDFQISCDHFWGNSSDLHNGPNGGFKYVKSSNQTIEFYKFWYSSRLKYPYKHDQDVLNFIKCDPFLHKIGLKIRFLDTAYFGGLCEPSKDLNKVCTMHTNCCIGLSRKLHDLRAILEDWKFFMSLPPSIKDSHLAFWSVPQNCSLDPINSTSSR